MKIIHIVESFGAGTYSFLTDLCGEVCKDNEIIILHSIRTETPINYHDNFDETVKLIEIAMSRNINLKSDFKSLVKIFNVLKSEKPDIIHLHSSKAGVLGRIVGFLLRYDRKKIFYNPHGYSFLQSNLSNGKRKIYWIIEKITALLSGTTIAVSKGEYYEGLKISKHVIQIDNSINSKSIDIQIKDEKKSKNEKIIGTIGRISEQKNPYLFNEIAKIFSNNKFIWIGDGELKNILTAPNIEITGWLKRADALEKLNGIDIYLQTSLWEGLPISLLEAMYMGKTPVVSNVVGNRDVIINEISGFVCSNIEEYNKNISLLISDENKYREISEKCKDYIVENHLIEDMIMKYKFVYGIK